MKVEITLTYRTVKKLPGKRNVQGYSTTVIPIFSLSIERQLSLLHLEGVDGVNSRLNIVFAYARLKPEKIPVSYSPGKPSEINQLSLHSEYEWRSTLATVSFLLKEIQRKLFYFWHHGLVSVVLRYYNSKEQKHVIHVGTTCRSLFY